MDFLEGRSHAHYEGIVGQTAFTALVLLFTIIPVLASAARFLIRLKSNRKPSWDDYFVLIATICLIVEAILVLDCQDELYVLEFGPDPEMVVITSQVSLPGFYIKTFTFTCLTWTAIFAIKLSFLALFRNLLWNISRRLKWFYIFVCGFTIITWFLIIMQIVLQSTVGCPALTQGFVRCPPINEAAIPYRLWLRMSFDLATDLASTVILPLLAATLTRVVISIPLSLLSTSQMKTRQKLWVAALLCLPIFMVIVTIVRAAAAPRRDVRGMMNIAAIWNTLLIHIEAGVAVLVASAVIFRSALAGLTSKRYSSDEEK